MRIYNDLRYRLSAAEFQCHQFHVITLNIKYDYEMCCLTPIEFRMSMNADPNAYFSLSTWILKSPTIKTLYAASPNSDRKSPNDLIKSK